MKYIISIPEPCDEKWNEMTPTEQGRFCAVCAKEIYDFTQITNRELVNKLKNNENICARYRKDQLDVDLYANSNTGLSRMGLLFSLTSLFAVSQPALAQDNSSVTTTEQKSQTAINTLEDNPKIASDSITIRGTVFDDLGPVLGASVFIKHTQNGTVTDFDGKFELVVDTSKEITLVGSFTGNSVEVIIKPQDFNKDIELVIEEEELTTGIIIVNKTTFTGRTLRKITRPIANLFRKKENRR